LPELLLLLGAVACLLVGAFVRRTRQWAVRLLAAAVLLGALAASAAALGRPPRQVYDGSYAVDTATGVTRVVVCAATLLVLAIAVHAVAGQPRESEAYVLMLLAADGSILLAGASDLLVLFIAFLLAAIPLYALVGLPRDGLATEAALKYYLTGALLGIVMIGGITVLFGATGRTDYAGLHATLPAAPRAAVAVGVLAVLAGLLFKAGAVPVHFWVPDVVAGASTPAAAFVTTVPKVGALVALLRLAQTVLAASAVDWRLIVAIVAAASMTLGNLAAFRQEAPKRLLAYSTISQVGYLLMAVVAAGRGDLADRALLYYLAAYAVTNLAVFAVVAELPGATALAAYAGLFARHRALALALVVGLLGLVGTPPLAVLVGKVGVFTAAAQAGYGWLVVLAAVNTVASLFYYLRWIAPLFASPPDRAGQQALAGGWGRVAAYTAAVGTAALGLGAGAGLALGTGPLLP